MRTLPRVVLSLFLSGLLARAGNQPAADLKARADAAQGSQRISLSLEYAHQQLEHANSLYTDGDVEEAEAAIQEVVAYSRQATETASAANKRLKQTEIELRKIEHRMRDIGQSLNIDDRPPVEKAVQQLEQFRANLLARMFGEKAEPKDKS
jgi:predicted MarR family transcription regulator